MSLVNQCCQIVFMVCFCQKLHIFLLIDCYKILYMDSWIASPTVPYLN